MDMGEIPEGMSLDRIDNNKGYSKDNCRWATREEQNKNKTSTILLTIDGVTMCAKDWAKTICVGQQQITNRVRSGMSHKDAYLDAMNAKHVRAMKKAWSKS